MNKIACLFLSDDIFIINIWDDYKLMGDTMVADTISTCIGFNKKMYNINQVKKYKGIVITRKTETFELEYIIANVFIKNKRKCVVANVDTITENINHISLNSQHSLNLHLINFDQSGCEFINFLTPLLKDFVFANITESKKIDYYNSLFDGIEYKSEINKETKIDLDIIIRNYFNIIGKDIIEEIEFNICKDHM
jgi:hypothetical protein